ncbi:hypothetical protein EVAR_32616_1 [Eumeta japonica]|uniref:Uncharacterized protein n=1 Tax=Eumeta variegata TaxID=151549 RepID=A0A4C1WGT4_EUMVA|nr:hypothetical protein EVAR_32616_1 [Eumeta japonica]
MKLHPFIIFKPVYNWFNEFKRFRTNALTRDLREGGLSMATAEDNISVVSFMINIDKRLTYQQIWTSLGIAPSKSKPNLVVESKLQTERREESNVETERGQNRKLNQDWNQEWDQN